MRQFEIRQPVYRVHKILSHMSDSIIHDGASFLLKYKAAVLSAEAGKLIG